VRVRAPAAATNHAFCIFPEKAFKKSALTPILTFPGKVSANPYSDQKIQKCRGRDRGVVTKIFWALSNFKNWPRPSETHSLKTHSQHRLQVTNSLLDREVKVGICHSETGPSGKFEVDPLLGTSLRKPALRSDSNPQFGYRTGRSKSENATPSRVWIANSRHGPKTIRIRKVSVNPDSDQKIQKCRGRDRGVVTKIFWALSKFKKVRDPSETRSPNPLSTPDSESQIRYRRGRAKVPICHSKAGLEWQIRDRPSPWNPSPKTALKISSTPQIGYCTGWSKRENATPRRVTCRKFETGPKTIRIRKVSVNPDSDQKIQKCRGRDRGVVTKFFWALSKFKN
jgi:hypothetical protein